jgi:hypothetical protein
VSPSGNSILLATDIESGDALAFCESFVAKGAQAASLGGDDAIHGRTACSLIRYMLGPRGDSNGSVSFKDYDAFLGAYRNGEIKRLAVVARLN